MSVDTPEQLQALRAAGRVVADALAATRRAVRPGITTQELDEGGARVFVWREQDRDLSSTTASPASTASASATGPSTGSPGRDA